jgi:hypothetical protein
MAFRSPIGASLGSKWWIWSSPYFWARSRSDMFAMYVNRILFGLWPGEVRKNVEYHTPSE